MNRFSRPHRLVLGLLLLLAAVGWGCSDGSIKSVLDEELDDGMLTPRPEGEQEAGLNNPGDRNLNPGGGQSDAGTGDEEGGEADLPDQVGDLPGNDGGSLPGDCCDEDQSHQKVALRLKLEGDLPAEVLKGKVYVDRILVEGEHNQILVLDQKDMALKVDLLSGGVLLLADIPLTVEGSVLVRVFLESAGEIGLESNDAAASIFPIVNRSTVKLRIRNMKRAAAAGIDMKIRLPESLSGVEEMEAPFVFTPKGDYRY